MKSGKPYDFYFLGENDNSYFFVTKSEIAYEIKFKPFPYLFDQKYEFAKNSFEFVIAIYSNETSQNPVFDINMGITIATIFDDFYQRNNSTITIYICDSSDSKQLARARKFSNWFLTFQNEAYFKTDALLFKENEELIPVSIIFRRDNPYKYQIMEAFEKLTDGYGQK
jgi:Family of unknown function (DUF6169)